MRMTVYSLQLLASRLKAFKNVRTPLRFVSTPSVFLRASVGKPDNAKPRPKNFRTLELPDFRTPLRPLRLCAGLSLVLSALPLHAQQPQLPQW